MIITKYHVSCDVCHIATLEIKSMMIHNAVKEIAESGWTATGIPGNPYISTHTCPGCQKKERRGED